MKLWYVKDHMISFKCQCPFQRYGMFSKLYENNDRIFYFSLTLIGISVTIQKSKKSLRYENENENEITV